MRKGKNIVAVIAFVVAIFLGFGVEGQKVFAHVLSIDEDPIFVSPNTGEGDEDNSSSGYIDIDYSPGSIYDGTSVLEINAQLEDISQWGANAQLGAAATDSSYDLRDYNRVTPVRNQFSGGTCWSFAAICSSESSAITEGLKTYSTDLSELQLAYFMYHTVSDPLGNFGTDGVYFGDGQDYEYFDFGGNDIYVSMALAKWTGVTEELSAMPYPATYGVDPNSDYDNQYAYSKDALHLENALWIDIGDKEAIQSNIVNYGAATISFFYSSTYLNTAVGKKGAYYYNGTTYGNNHAVAIVGWDDNYPKTNFRIQPKANGAWLIKNSYGTGNGDGGYLWVSYYDRGITGSNYYYPGNTAVFTDFGEVSRFDNNYQYDGGIGLHYYYYPDGNASMSNIFVAKSHEKLGGVSFYTYGTNSAYTVRIFKLHGGDVDPTDGSLVGTVSGVQMYEGYHTVNLDSEIELMAGDRFSVVIDLIASPGAYAYVFVDVADTLFGTDYPYSNATCNTGESYLSEDGVTWEESDYNCRIKAFTVNDEEINIVVNNPANSHLFRVEGSGNEIQNNLSNKMTDIVYVAESGTSGCSKRLEALQVVLVPKGQAAPGDTSSPYVAR